MDTQKFLAEFGHIANAPGGIARLRELVIQLAISGRLVERIESEAPVSAAIEVAAKLRNAYEVELDLRATRMQPALLSRPFPVPDHWQWTRLEQICLYIQRRKEIALCCMNPIALPPQSAPMTNQSLTIARFFVR